MSEISLKFYSELVKHHPKGMPKSGGGKKFKERIKKKINEASTPKTTEGPPTKKSIQSEMSHYENTKQLGDNLEKLFLVLKNIAPTSVSAEQAFSVAGSFVPNRRSRLTDVSIVDLCFEKSYFDNNGYMN